MEQPTSSTMEPLSVSERPSLWRFLRVWLMLGLQSFGGGSATLFLIRRAVVEQQRWVTPDEFTRDWALCFMTPGINLLCMTILVGWRVAGVLGALLALFGLLTPSVTITIVMIAFYADVQQLAVVQSALRGVVPATVGLGLVLAVSTVRPLIRDSRRESLGSLVLSGLLLAGSALAGSLLHLPVAVSLCASGVICGLAMWWRAARLARRP